MNLTKILKRKRRKATALLPPSSSTTKKSQDPKATPPSESLLSLPTRSKNVTFITDDDDISAITRGTDMPDSPDRSPMSSPSNSERKRIGLGSPPPNHPLSLLARNDDDSGSQDLLVFEDKMENDSMGSAGAGAGFIPNKFSSTSKLRVRFSDTANDDNDANNNTHGISVDGGATTMVKQLFVGDNENYNHLLPKKEQNDKNTISRSSSSSSRSSNSSNSIISKRAILSKLVQRKSSWLTQTEYFRNAVNSSFDKIDVDKSGDVTLEELYAGLLLIHLKFAIYVGAPACRPASKKYVSEVFHIVDTDNNGTLDREEFATVMKILYSQVFTRIVLQWTLALMIIPVTTKHIIHYTTQFFWGVHEFWKDIDDDLDPLERMVSKVWEILLHYSPDALEKVGVMAWLIFSKIPWRSMPPIILTVAQTSVVLPFILNHVEDFFRRAAHMIVSGEDVASEE